MMVRCRVEGSMGLETLKTRAVASIAQQGHY